MIKNICFFLLLGCGIVACKNQVTPEKSPIENPTEFGNAFTLDTPIQWDTIMAKIGTQDTVFGQVKGTVQEVCQASGCWMNIVNPDDPNSEPLFVKFEGYSFFVPKDIAGKTVQLSGKAYREETSVEELKHYAEDEGQSEEEIAKITEPLVEMKFMATGVIITE